MEMKSKYIENKYAEINDNEEMMQELEREHELKMLDLERGWLGRFFCKLFGSDW